MKLDIKEYDEVQKKLGEVNKLLSEIKKITNEANIEILVNKGHEVVTEIRKELWKQISD